MRNPEKSVTNGTQELLVRLGFWSGRFSQSFFGSQDYGQRLGAMLTTMAFFLVAVLLALGIAADSLWARLRH
jgi:4-amino-4-deoxy-L-arabinose transferase-like glycosyltransferase